jgi:flagellar motor switch protein FliM
MTFAVDPTVLRRKIADHARTPAARPDPGPQAARALGRALRHAATPFEGLGLIPGKITVEVGQDLDAAIAALPDHGLVAALEQEGSRGLLGLAPGLVDALVEVQTTGRVEAAELPPRQVTRIDEALARDFIDLVLAAFAREAATIEARDWPDRLGYGSRIRDRGQVSLLLPEASYTVLSADLGFDGVERRTRLVLVLPSNPALARKVAPDRPRPVDPAWVAARTGLIETLRLPLEVVLMRVTQPLCEVQRLAVGDLLPFGVADLQEVSLETLEGRVLAHGRLGQLGGRRALRLPPRHVPQPPSGTPEEPKVHTDPAPPHAAPQPALPTTTDTATH